MRYYGPVTNPKDIVTKEYVDGSTGKIKTITSNRGPLPSDVGTPGQRWLDTAHGNVEYTCVGVTVGTPNTYAWLYTGGCNDNLLDNWYFVGGASQQGGGQFPINQRAGYLVPPGTNIYNDTALISLVGSTTSYYRIVSIGNDYNTIVSPGGNSFYTSPNTQVPGYTGAGYGIDRYCIESNGTLTINDKYCSFSGTSMQSCEDTTVDSLVGKTVTISALTYDGRLVSATGKVNPKNQDTIISAALNSNNAYIELHFFANAQSYQMCRIYGGVNNGTVNLVAVKLELGDTQTLAHQDENGNWVLNEVPNFQQELAKCQRYQLALPFVIGRAISTAISDGNGEVVFPISLPVTPRSNGILSILSGHLRLHGPNIDYFNVTPNQASTVQGNIAGIGISGLERMTPYTIDGYPPGTILFDFNL